MEALFVLVLSCVPVTSDQPVVVQTVYESRDACTRNVVAMQQVFEMMRNDSAVMKCQSLRSLEASVR